jgi:hypothetical protein
MFRGPHKTGRGWHWRHSCGAKLLLISRFAPRGDRGRRRCRVSSNSPQSLADYISAICTKSFGSAPAAEAPYLAENVSAMTKMMIDMGTRPSGDVDTDFVALMVPHHQGAIEMAQAELRYGRNGSLRRMAQEIIVTQLQEITAMRLSLGQPLPPSVPSPDQIPTAAMSESKTE